MKNTFDSMTHNLAGHLKDPVKRRLAGTVAINHCIGGIGVLNEIHKDDVGYYRKHLRAHGLAWYRRGQNAIVWDTEVFENHACGTHRVSRGGFIGADGVRGRGEDRRVGPNRYAIKWKGVHRDTGKPFMVLGVHFMAKAFTTAPWRAGLFFKGVRQTGWYIHRSIRRYPNGFIAGDMNSKELIDFPQVNDKPVNTPATHGNARYDQVSTFGAVNAVNVQEFRTPSDHDGLTWQTVLLKG